MRDGLALVTGATGFIGRALVERLTAAGQRAVLLTRARDFAAPAGTDVRFADLSTGEGVSPALFEGVSHVFHLAGEIRRPAAMTALHVDGTARLLQALRAAELREPVRWVQLSSVGAYGPPARPGAARDVDETTPENPRGTYETTKTASDHLVREAAAAGILSASVLRPSAVIGPGMSNTSLPALIGLIRRGLFVHVGPGDAIANYVHVDDVVEALQRCGADPRAVGETFNLSADCRWSDLVGAIAKAAGVREPRLRIPAPLALGAAALARVVPGLPVTPERVAILIGRSHYSTARLEQTLGFRIGRPMPAAVIGCVAP